MKIAACDLDDPAALIAAAGRCLFDVINRRHPAQRSRSVGKPACRFGIVQFVPADPVRCRGIGINGDYLKVSVSQPHQPVMRRHQRVLAASGQVCAEACLDNSRSIAQLRGADHHMIKP